HLPAGPAARRAGRQRGRLGSVGQGSASRGSGTGGGGLESAPGRRCWHGLTRAEKKRGGAPTLGCATPFSCCSCKGGSLFQDSVQTVPAEGHPCPGFC